MSNKKYQVKYLLIAVLAIVFFYSFKPSDEYKITADAVISHIKYLASDELGGRFPGTLGDSLAEKYAIKQFKNDGLVPIGDDGYKEKFDFVSQIKTGTGNAFSWQENNYKMGEDFYPMGFSANGTATGGLVFVGYGINSPGLAAAVAALDSLG